jgi:hypothetical protein
MSVEVMDNLDYSDNIAVEFGNVFRWYPILALYFRASGLNLVPAEVLASDLETQNVPFSAIPGVPISRDLNRILLFEYRIKDGLIRKTRRKGFPSAVADQNQFGFPNGAKQHNGIHS